MIVNPQLLNYRLIISSLLIVLTVLGVFSFTNYKSIESYEVFLSQEKVLIETELSELLSSYDALNEDYNFTDSQLQDAKLETKKALESLRALESDLSIITKYKDQLQILKSKNKVFFNTIDSLQAANKKLAIEKRHALNIIKAKTDSINNLEEVNSTLNAAIHKAATIRASHVNAQAYGVKFEKKHYTNRAKRADAIEVCITLNENPLAPAGYKNIYIQIVSPQGNVVSDKGEIVFGETSLNYSTREGVFYENSNLEVCSAIVADKEDHPLLKGRYFIHVFNESVKLGSTSLELK